MTSQPEPAPAAELKTDIAATRADLAQTLAALTAKAQVKARAGDAAKNALSRTKGELVSIPGRVLGGVDNLFRRTRSMTTSTQRRLSAGAVLAAGLTALLAVHQAGNKRGRR
jgi:hypothetical protein